MARQYGDSARSPRQRLVRLFLLSCLLSSSLAVGVAPATSAAPANPPAVAPQATNTTGAVLSVYPDPERGGDAGEYVVVRLPEPGNWTLSDGESTVPLRNYSGRVVVGSELELLRDRFPNTSVVAAPLSLSNAGETLVLRRDGELVQRVRYGDSTEAHRYVPKTGEWRARGFTPREAVTTGPANATGFLLPDSPTLALETLRGAEERILLAGYTFASERVATALAAAAKRGITVRVLVEAEPVGGISRRQARLLDRLVAAGVAVRVVGIGTSRYAFHHPKYAVVDDRALVLTENWKPSGTGGRSNRGWGVLVDDRTTAAELVDIFVHDVDAPDTQKWSAFRRGRTFERIPSANGSYPSEHAPKQFQARNVTVLTAPGNAESAIVDYIDGADERIDILQPTLGREGNALVEATLRAARRGVEVRILLSGAWYVAEENAALVSWLEGWAERNDAPLSVRLAEPGGRYEKIHAKGLLVDDEVAVVGSLNWNRDSARENREVALALHGPEPVAYYRGSFEEDWAGGGRNRTWLYAAGAGAAVVVAGFVAVRTVSFADEAR
ncbi:MAG: phospholipase D-like domain-containing protein [Halolamina sp.]